MKRLLLIFFAFFILSLSGCGKGRADSGVPRDSLSSSEKISVVTTIFPPYDFVRQVAGDRAELTMLLPPGTESHSYEPSPQDIITIQESDIFICVGGESDVWVKEILNSMDRDSMKIIPLMSTVEAAEEEFVEGMEGGHESEGSHDIDKEAEYDEHVWTSPLNSIKIVNSITEALCSADSANSDYYAQSAREYITELSRLDEQLRQVTNSAKRNTLIFGDRFPFRYLADEYGLEYYAAFPGCSTETEASAATVAFLIDKVSEESIPSVFHIELSNEKMAGTISEATGAKKLLLHSCHNLTKDDFESGATYVSLMEQNIENLKEALN